MTSNMLTMPALRLPWRPRLPHAKQWFAFLVLATTAGLYLLAALSVTASGSDPARANVPRIVSSQQLFVPGLGAPPVPEPLQFRDVTPQDAQAINAAIPISTDPNPAARPYREAFATPADQLRATECLAAAIYYEAAIEPIDGQRAVAQVVLNRVRHPAFPKSVCGVVFQGSDRSTGCQFTFTCDGALNRTPVAALWERARKVAEEALAGKVYRAGRLVDPLSHQLGGAVLERIADQGCGGRKPYLLPLGRRLGPPDRLPLRCRRAPSRKSR